MSSCLPRLFFSCALLVVICSVRGESAGQTALTPSEIREAIEYGKASTPRPYLLRQAGPEGNPSVVGLVYTSFIRVALLSRAASERGATITLDEIKTESLEPTVHIAFRWPYIGPPYDPPDLADFNPRAPPDPEVLALSVGSGTSGIKAEGIPPLRVHTGTALTEQYGRFDGYDDIAVVAEFPATMLKSGQSFRIAKYLTPTVFRYAVGVIRAADLARWR